MSNILEKFQGCTFYSGDYGKFSSILYNNQLIDENLSKVTTMVVKTNNKTKTLIQTLNFFPNLHTVKIEKANKVTDLNFLNELKNLKELLVQETLSQKDWEFLKDILLEKLTVYSISNISINLLPNSLEKLSLYGSFEYSSLTNLENLKELIIDNSSGNPLLKEIKDLPNEYELPLLPKSLENLVIRGSCKLKNNGFLEKLNSTCKIYTPDKGCQDLSIPDRFSNTSR